MFTAGGNRANPAAGRKETAGERWTVDVGAKVSCGWGCRGVLCITGIEVSLGQGDAEVKGKSRGELWM